jgi:hypothetical protein
MELATDVISDINNDKDVHYCCSTIHTTFIIFSFTFMNEIYNLRVN